MPLAFKPVTLASDTPDQDATLVFRDGRLVAVLTRLSDIHAELAGKWFVEAAFGGVPGGQAPVFDSTERFEEWVRKAG